MKKIIIGIVAAVGIGILSFNMFGTSTEDDSKTTLLEASSLSDTNNVFKQNISGIEAGDTDLDGEINTVNSSENSDLKPLPSVSKDLLVSPNTKDEPKAEQIPNAKGKVLAEPIPNATGEYEVINLLPEDEELEETNFSFGEKNPVRDGFEVNEELETGINGGGL